MHYHSEEQFEILSKAENESTGVVLQSDHSRHSIYAHRKIVERKSQVLESVLSKLHAKDKAEVLRRTYRNELGDKIDYSTSAEYENKMSDGFIIFLKQLISENSSNYLKQLTIHF